MPWLSSGPGVGSPIRPAGSAVPARLGRMTKTALITGITGQDGSYLAELLLEKGYRVVGMTRRSSTASNERIAHLAGRIELVQGDLLDQASLVEALRRVEPTEVYNLAAQSFVPTSWNQPVLTGEFTGPRRDPDARGDPPGRPDDPLLPGVVERDVRQGPRGAAERGHAVLPAQPVRRRQGLRRTSSRSTTARATACMRVSGILFNHESPRRGLEFVTRKVTDGAARIALGLATELPMGNLDAERDWGFAGDYVRAMWLMLQQPEPGDYVDRDRRGALRPRAVPDRLRPRRPRLRAPRRSTTGPLPTGRGRSAARRRSRARTELGWAPTVAFQRARSR